MIKNSRSFFRPTILLIAVWVFIHGLAFPQQTSQNNFSTTIIKEISASYLLTLPKGYSEDIDPKPLLLFLHGGGERGDDLNRIKQHGPLNHVEEGVNLPFIIVSPQVPAGGFWKVDVLLALLEKIIQKHNVDESRVYVTGLSMGGYGTWDVAIARPDLFAAVAPIAGGGNPVGVCRLKDTPVWVFHGDNDTVVPPINSREMVRWLEGCNGNVRLTIYPETGHDSWTETYANPAFYDWLLEHQLEM